MMKNVSIGILFISLWIPVYLTGLIFKILSIFPRFFEICIQGYLFLFAIVNLIILLRSRKIKLKFNQSSIIINELILVISYFTLVFYFPYLFPFPIEDPIRVFTFFNLWNSLTIHLLCWAIYLYFAHRNNIKKARNLDYSEWIQIVSELNSHKTNFQKNFKRKIMHFGITVGIVAIYLITQLFNNLILKWSIEPSLFVRYWWFSIGLHLLWVMNIADIIRLSRFSLLGRFATRWYESSIRSKEFYTFTSANLMLISWFPFLFAPFPTFILIGAIGATSDALASIFGHKYGKKVDSRGKTFAGYLAGFLSTFALANIILFIFASHFYSPLIILLISLLTGFGFLLADLSSKKISDNFLNPMITGIILWFSLILFK